MFSEVGAKIVSLHGGAEGEFLGGWSAEEHLRDKDGETQPDRNLNQHT